MSIWPADGQFSRKQYFNTIPGAKTPAIIEHVIAPVMSKIGWMYSPIMIDTVMGFRPNFHVVAGVACARQRPSAYLSAA